MKIDLKLGDCQEVLKGLPDNSIDAVVTDPPAGIAFMGKTWDDFSGAKTTKSQLITNMNAGVAFSSKGLFEFQEFIYQVFVEILRVVKPGGHIFVWALPRTSHHTAMGIERAGFEIRDVITHLFGSGFPKSYNIGKGIDKMMGAERENGKLRTNGRGKDILRIENHVKGMTGIGHADGSKQKYYETTPATLEAQQWDGWGTALKPASEHWILARKPLSEKTIVKNVLKWRTGGINIDDCRIATDWKNERGETWLKSGTNKDGYIGREAQTPSNHYNTCSDRVSNLGRFPANVILEKSYIQVLTLREDCDIIISSIIGGYYDNYEVPKLWERISGIQESSEEWAEKILQSQMLQRVAEKESPEVNVGEEAYTKIKTENGGIQSEEQKSGEGRLKLQGGLYGERISLYQSSRVGRGGQNDSVSDDEEGISTRTQSDDGDKFGKTIEECGDSSSQEWDKDRQQNREFRDNQQYKSHTVASQADSRKQTLEVLAPDVPRAWLRYFRPAGYSVIDPFCSARMLDEQSGIKKGGFVRNRTAGARPFNNNGKDTGYITEEIIDEPNGGASRFFYCAKASRSERNAGLEEDKICTHPTVKPISLMRYLCRLITPPNGTVLDPFMGSGTTGIACVREGFDFIGIEQDTEYMEIAKRRIEYWSSHED